VTKPVHWQKGIEAMLQRGIDLFIEIGCGKTLQGMNKKIGVVPPTKSLEKAGELAEFMQIEELVHGTT
jgi:[acyl-carrier-protein] S-malonyltransferase